MARLFRQFSFPGGIPSHCRPETPGSIHEGGELGYSLAHAFGAAFDNPDLVVACVVGDGEAETGPAATGWHSNKFLDPGQRRDGAADPPPERLQDRRPDRAGPDPRRRAAGPVHRVRLPAGPGGGRVRRRGAGGRSTSAWRPPSTGSSTRSPRLQAAARTRPDRPAGPAGPCSSCAPPRAGPGPRWSTGCRSRAPSGPTSSRWPRSGRTRRTWPCWRSGCAATGPRSSSTPRVVRRPPSWQCRPAGTDA